MLTLLAVAVLAPLLYIPGYLIAHALLGAAQPPDPLERHYERVVAGALLNGWLALTLAEFGVFSAPLHLLLLLAICAICAVVAWRRSALHLPQAPLGIIARPLRPMTGGLRIEDRGWRIENRRTPSSILHPLSSILVGRWSVIKHWDALAFAAIGLVFALMVARPFEVVLGARDAGVYATTGFAIARNGGIVQYDDLVRQIALDRQAADPQLRAAAAQAETNFLGTQDASRFMATRLRYAGFLINQGDLEGGRVVPQFFHLYPAWIALLASLLGLRGGLLATNLLGLLGVWSVGMLGRRLAGPWVGVLGALFLALNGVQVWFSRYSTSEACAQFLSFAALYGFAAMHDDRPYGRKGRSIERPYERPHDERRSNVPTLFAAVIAGVAAGQLALTRIDFFVLVVPLIAYLLYIVLTRRWTRAHWALAGGLVAMLLQTLLHIVFISRAYFLDTLYARLQDQSAIVARLAYLLWTPALRKQFLEIPRAAPLRQPLRLPLELVLLTVLVVALILLWRDGRLLRRAEGVALRYRRRLLGLCTAGIALLGIYGYLIRPQILTARTLAALPDCLAPAQLRGPSGACLALQGYIGAPIAPPDHPNPIGYLLDSAPKWLWGRRPVAIAQLSAVRDGALRETPGAGTPLDRIRAGEATQLLGRDRPGTAYLVTDARGVTGWVDAATLAVDPALAEQAPVQSGSVVAGIANPRGATTFSPGNPGESEKIAIAQANLVRVGWYLSPIGVILGIAGFALWWRRGLDRAAWLFLVAALVSTFFFVRLTYGSSDLTYIYILRRYVPLAYPAFSLGMAYAIVSILDFRFWILDLKHDRSKIQNPKSKIGLVVAASLTVALIGFLAATNRPIYRHVEYAGALEQLAAVADRFRPGDVLLFRGEARDTPDLVATPLKYAFGMNTFAIKSGDPGKYGAELASYVRRWQAQGREVYLALGANGAVALPGLRPVPIGPLSLRLPEFQQLRDQKPSGIQEFAFEFMIYRLAPADAAPPVVAARVAVDDYTAQLRGFYRPEQIGGATIAWTDGDALLRLPWPADAGPRELSIDLAPGATRPATLGPARVCLSYRPELSFALDDRPFLGEQCFELGAGMRGYRFTIEARGRPAPATGTLLLRIASGKPWVPADADPAQHDQRSLGVQFGGVENRD